tara:strand:- start:1305 stop:1649 length:345 start_codon:yes stop_codon:yes gene_type:complete
MTELLKQADDAAKELNSWTCDEFLWKDEAANLAKLIKALAEELRRKEKRILELERVVTDGRMYADKIADDWEKAADWLDKKGYVMLSSLIVIREMLSRIFKETEKVLPQPKQED